MEGGLTYERAACKRAFSLSLVNPVRVVSWEL